MTFEEQVMQIWARVKDLQQQCDDSNRAERATNEPHGLESYRFEKRARELKRDEKAVAARRHSKKGQRAVLGDPTRP